MEAYILVWNFYNNSPDHTILSKKGNQPNWYWLIWYSIIAVTWMCPLWMQIHTLVWQLKPFFFFETVRLFHLVSNRRIHFPLAHQSMTKNHFERNNQHWAKANISVKVTNALAMLHQCCCKVCHFMGIHIFCDYILGKLTCFSLQQITVMNMTRKCDKWHGFDRRLNWCALPATNNPVCEHSIN